jgi:hypothetical protein
MGVVFKARDTHLVRFVGHGLRLEFQHPSYRRIVTSQIMEGRAGERRANNA